jgi:hypothetical protein
MLVSSPFIGRLMVRPRKWAQRRIVAGDFGPIVKRGRANLVDLRNVQAATGKSFSPQQITEAAGKFTTEEAL